MFLSDLASVRMGRDLSESLEIIKDRFRSKCCPISQMKVNIGIKMMPIHSLEILTLFPKRPRIVTLGIYGCPQRNARHDNDNIRKSVVNACTYGALCQKMSLILRK